MEKGKLSIIIPFVGEYPQVLFTIQAVAQELLSVNSIDFEIIAVDNYCEQAYKQVINIGDKIVRHYSGKELKIEDIFAIHNKITPLYENRSGEAIEACSKGNGWLKYVSYDERLSHWQAKRVGVEASEGEFLLFLDAHVIPSHGSIVSTYENYVFGELHEIGTMHLPLTYKILEWRRLIYKMHVENNYFYSYKFTSIGDRKNIFEVPCMSTCGMMISKKIYGDIGGWPDTLGIYGGGENFMNYTLAVCRYRKFINSNFTLFHHGDRRDYHYEGDDLIYNRMLAHYIFGGQELLEKFAGICRGNPIVLERLRYKAMQNGLNQRKRIKEIQKVSIEEWAKEWDCAE